MLQYLVGFGSLEELDLRLLVIFYGNLLVLPVTENRNHIVNKNSISFNAYQSINSNLSNAALPYLYKSKC